jgi:hypothetical protein
MLDFKDKNYISFLILSNENINLTFDFLVELEKEILENFENFEIILIDENYKCKEILEKLKKLTIKMSIIYLNKDYGKESSINLGIEKCIGDYIFVFERYIPDSKFIKFAIGKYKDNLGMEDITLIGYKEKSILKKIFYKIMSNNEKDKYLPILVSIISRKALNRIKSIFNTSLYRNSEYRISGLKLGQEIYEYKYNDKFNIKNINLGIDSMLIYTDIVFKVGTFVTVFFFFISIFSILYTIYFYLINKTIQGWTTVMLLLSVSFFGLFLILNLFLRYLNLILRNSFYKRNIFSDRIENV